MVSHTDCMKNVDECWTLSLGAFGLTAKEQLKILGWIGNLLSPLIVLASLALCFLHLSYISRLIATLMMISWLSSLIAKLTGSLSFLIVFYVTTFLWLVCHIIRIVDNSCYRLLPLPLFIVGVISTLFLHGMVMLKNLLTNPVPTTSSLSQHLTPASDPTGPESILSSRSSSVRTKPRKNRKSSYKVKVQ